MRPKAAVAAAEVGGALADATGTAMLASANINDRTIAFICLPQMMAPSHARVFPERRRR
jgi:hypothetical protein